MGPLSKREAAELEKRTRPKDPPPAGNVLIIEPKKEASDDDK